MENLINIFILLPVLGFLLSWFIPAGKERWISANAYLTSGIFLGMVVLFTAFWGLSGARMLEIRNITLFEGKNYAFFIDFCFDKTTAVYAITGSFLALLITSYSRVYLHREQGYKRFFNTILFFFMGYNVVVFAGNLETLFLGWEILGVASFLLIAFYQNRYLPVRNANKVYSVYRIADVGILLAMWLSHHLWNANVTFSQIQQDASVYAHLQSHSLLGTIISLLLLLSASAKSAQIPFTSWLPRAMEGPTPSSAIFYGALSVHMGAFLLIRTYPFWENQMLVHWLIGGVGLSTALIASGIARVQSSVKTQIAYASASQIGIIFIEIALGWHNLALIHFAGNAALRSYQLLVSPSVVSYMIREQLFGKPGTSSNLENLLPQRWRNSLYLLHLREWRMDDLLYYMIWHPLRWTGKRLGRFKTSKLVLVYSLFLLLGILALQIQGQLPAWLSGSIPEFFAALALLMVLRAFAEKNDPKLAWLLIFLNHGWIALAVSFNEHFTMSHHALYLSGIVVAAIGGWGLLSRLQKQERGLDLESYHGKVYEYPVMAFVFLIMCLGMSGFPITPTFVGEDLIFSHIHENQFLLAFFISLSFILDGIVIFRIYSKIFLGPNDRNDHAKAWRSS